MAEQCCQSSWGRKDIFFGEGHFLGTLARVSFSLGTGFSYRMSDFTCSSQTTVRLDKVTGEAGIVAPCLLTEHKLCIYNRTGYLLYCSSSLRNLHLSNKEEGKKKPRLLEVGLTCIDHSYKGTHLGFCSSCVKSRGLDKAFSLGADELKLLGTVVLLSPLY